MRRALITGVTGFIGASLSTHLVERGWIVRGISRRPRSMKSFVQMLTVESFTELTPTHPAFENVDAVIHLAGRAHASGMNRAESEAAFAADAQGTKQLAKAAAQAGVRRFIFVSTAKVLGEEGVFVHDSVSAPVDEYSRYKLVAENAVHECAELVGMEWVVVRPVLVFGKGMKGNLARLLRWISQGYPLPFRGLENRRSLIALSDLNDLLEICIASPDVSGARLLAGGDEALSTTEICAALAEGLGVPSRFVKIPSWAWRALRAFPPTSSRVQRVAGSFVVDNAHTKELANWQPQISAREGLAAAAHSSLAGN